MSRLRIQLAPPISIDLGQQLEKAIRENDYDTLKRHLDSRDDLLELPLQHEFKKNNETLALNVTPLVLAVKLGNTSIVKLLLEKNAEVNTEVPELGGTALHLASQYGHKDSVDLLLPKIADINQKDCGGSSPLHQACRYGNVEIAACLLDAQADISHRDNLRNTSFHIASMYGQQKVLQLLWNRGSKEQINETNIYSNSALHLACINNRKETAEWLLDLGAAIELRNKHGLTPLHVACGEGRIEVIEMLLKRQANIHQKSDSLSTPILHSCYHLQLQSLTTLLRHGALVTDIDRFGSNCLHQVVLSKKKSSNVLRDILMKLIGGGVNINGLNISGCSPLHLACIHQNLKIVEHLLNLGADFNQRGTLIGSTALMEACCKSDVEIVKTLLKWGVDMTITNHHGLTALALACRFNQLESVKALIKHGSAVAFCTKAGLTPLCTAAINNNIDIALEILITPDYFPENPAKEKAFTERVANKADVQKIEDKLLQSFETTKYEKQEQLQAILNWAISNGALKLAKHCISQSPQVLQCERNGATWLHVAAQHGQHEFIQFLWSETDALETDVGKAPYHKIDVMAVAKGNTTALHTATTDGSIEVVRLLLDRITKQSERVAAILQQNSQSQSPLTISINQKHKDLEGLFWNAIRQLGTTDKSYMDSHLVEANRILKALAQYETPRHEVVLNELLQQWFKGGSDEGQQGLTTLGWAVRRSQPVVVWWLLSKGGYSSGYDIESAQKLLPNPCLDPVQRLIKKLLLDPPPILDQVANPNNDDITSPPPPMNTKSPALDIQGNIVDIYTSGETVSIPYTSASIDDIIYKKGPESLMKNARRNWNQRYLDELEEELGRMGSNSSASQHEALRMASKSSEHDISDNEECSNDITGVFKFRWIHLPVNELHLMRDLVCRMSHDSKRLEMDHTALMKHFNRSWTELAAGGKQNYMKPQCVRKEIDHINHSDDDLDRSKPLGKSNTCTALYMPYLTLGKYNSSKSKHNTDEVSELGKYIGTRHSRQIRHNPLTLDQYYYPILTDTEKRDNDQVLSKSLEKKGKQGERKILMVNQLWVWIIDEKTIITAATRDPSRESTWSLVESVLDDLLYGGTKNRLERDISVQSVMELVLGVATQSFVEKTISSLDPGSKRPTGKKGPIEIFRESIRDVAEAENQLFRDFLAGLRKEAGEQRGQHGNESRLKSRTEQTSRNRYHIISSETELLEETRDICDELQILRSLAEDQDVVWKQAFSPSDMRDQLQYYHSCTPTDVKKSLNEMLLEAEKTTNYINDLLNLRQAEYSRVQAKDSAKQSNSIFIFTLITIVFLPLSFLSSLFALNVSDFPHESGNLVYEGWWLFPILFGVTAIVSIPAIFFAWNVNDISEWLRGRGSSTERPTAASDEKNDGTLSQQRTTKFFSKYLKLRRRRVEKNNKNTLPQHENPREAVYLEKGL